MPVLVESDKELARELGHALPAGSPTLRSLGELQQWLGDRDDESAVVIGPSVDQAAVATFADGRRLTHPATSVILVRHELKAELFELALVSGISAVVAREDLTGVMAAVTRARQSWEAIQGPAVGGEDAPRAGRVLTVFSPKGGVGKTTLSVNLGLALAQQGQRVCLIDLDLAFGDVAITMQLIPEHTISEAVSAGDAVDYPMLQTLLTSYEDTLTVLAAPTHPDGKDRIPASLIPRVIHALRDQFDFLVIDTPPAFDDHVLHAFDETDECVLIATLDVPTVKNTKLAVETLDALKLVTGRRHLVLNRADGDVGLTRAEVEKILSMPAVCTLPTSIDVLSATNQGQPLVASDPQHPFSQGVAELASRFSGVSAPAKVTEATRAKGLFGRRKQVS